MKQQLTQKQIVLAYLLSGKSITQRKAIVNWSIIRLSQIIFNLKKDGYEITTERVINEIYKGSYIKYRLKNKNVRQ